MTVSSRARLRRFWFLVHMWIGVGLFLVLIPLSLSGSWLVWRPELDRMQHPARYPTGAGPAALPVSAYLASAQAALGDRARVATIRMPAHAGDPVIVQAQVRRAERTEGQPRPARQPNLSVWLDPASGKALDVADPRGGLSGFAHDLHGQLFMFGGGRQVVGWLGVLMLGSCLTGLWLWWPKAGPLTLGFRWRRGPGVLINLHYLTGFWIAVPLAVLSLTGALVAFPQFTRGMVAMTAPVSPAQVRRDGGRPLGRTALTPDQAASAAVTAAGGGKLLSLALPSKSPAPPAWRIQVARAGGAPANVSVADALGAAATLQPADRRTSGDQLIRLNRQIHDGDDAPLIWKLIITLAGLAPALLGTTGVIVWARSQLRKAALRRTQAAVVELAPVA